MSGERKGGEEAEGGKEEENEATKKDNFVPDCEDPELEDLLQSTLSDFESKPVLGADAGGAGDASGNDSFSLNLFEIYIYIYIFFLKTSFWREPQQA